MDKKYKIVSNRLTTLTDKDLIKLQCIVVGYLKNQAFITNLILRKITGATYDQAIFFYKEMLKQKVFKKIGIKSTTRYILNAKS